MASRVRRPDLERDHGSPPAPPFIAYLGGGLLALGILLAVLVAIDAWEGRRGNGEATLLLAGTLAIIATPFLLVARTMVRRNAQIWRNGRLAEATVTSVKEASVQISRYEEPRWIIDYTYRDASGVTHTGRSGYVARHIAATWRVGDKGRIRIDDRDPAASVWIDRNLAGRHPIGAQPARPPSLFDVAGRIPSFWTGPFLVVAGFVVAAVTGGTWGPVEGLAVSLGGVALFVAGARRIWIAHDVLKCGVEADATVSSVTTSLIGARIAPWKCVIHYRYADDRGQPHEAREYLSGAAAVGWTPGRRGRIRFDPRRPGYSVWIGALPSLPQPNRP